MKIYKIMRSVMAVLMVLLMMAATACGDSHTNADEPADVTATTTVSVQTTTGAKTTAATETVQTTTATTTAVNTTPRYLVDADALKALSASDSFAITVEGVEITDGTAYISLKNNAVEEYETLKLYAVGYNDRHEGTWLGVKSTAEVSAVRAISPIITSFPVGETVKVRMDCDPDQTADVLAIVAQYTTKDETVTENPIAEDWVKAAFIPNPAY